MNSKAMAKFSCSLTIKLKKLLTFAKEIILFIAFWCLNNNFNFNQEQNIKSNQNMFLWARRICLALLWGYQQALWLVGWQDSKDFFNQPKKILEGCQENGRITK